MDIQYHTKVAQVWGTLVVVAGILLLASLVPSSLLTGREPRRWVLLDPVELEPGLGGAGPDSMTSLPIPIAGK